MGILNLSKVYNGDEKKGLPSLVREVLISELQGKRLVVDSNSIFYAYWNRSTRDVCDHQPQLLENGPDMDRIRTSWLGACARVVNRWIDSGMDVTLVLDGRAPIHKDNTQAKRQRGKQDYIEEAEAIAKTACHLVGLTHNEGSVRIGEIMDVDAKTMVSVNALRARHRQCLINGIGPRAGDWVELSDHLIRKEGMRVIRSNVEAETLCCKMVHTGQADYVLSSDVDCLAYRVPCWIRAWNDWEKTFEIVYLQDVLDRLGLNSDQFLSYCIMLGCDYNVHITKRKDGSDTRMGPVDILKRLKKYKTLEGIMQADTTIDWSQLNLEACLSIFELQIEVESVSISQSQEILIS